MRSTNKNRKAKTNEERKKNKTEKAKDQTNEPLRQIRVGSEQARFSGRIQQPNRHWPPSLRSSEVNEGTQSPTHTQREREREMYKFFADSIRHLENPSLLENTPHTLSLFFSLDTASTINLLLPILSQCLFIFFFNF